MASGLGLERSTSGGVERCMKYSVVLVMSGGWFCIREAQVSGTIKPATYV